MTAPSREELIGLLRDAEDCHALFGDAADALEEDREQIGGRWQTIESATRITGLRMLVLYKHKGKWVMIASYLDPHGRWLSSPGAWHVQPTHWMPLPSPPGGGG